MLYSNNTDTGNCTEITTQYTTGYLVITAPELRLFRVTFHRITRIVIILCIIIMLQIISCDTVYSPISYYYYLYLFSRTLRYPLIYHCEYFITFKFFFFSHSFYFETSSKLSIAIRYDCENRAISHSNDVSFSKPSVLLAVTSL